MRIDHVRSLRCPFEKSPMRLVDPVVEDGEVVSGTLVSPENRRYPIEHGTPNFVDAARLTPVEARNRSEYDVVADGIYDLAIDWQFAAMGENEDAVRESMVEMLALKPDASILEIGCGTGRDSFRLARRLSAAGRLHMQDLSAAMVAACARRMANVHATTPFRCTLDYSVSSANHLPFADGAFDAVFHFGGFNQFGDLKAGAAEMARVVATGGRVVVGDEAVAPWLKETEFDAIVTTNNPLFKADTPLDVLPICARDVTVRWIIGNCFYVIGFTKGDGPPAIDLDLPHQGRRGGTMRTRYFGQLEGVTSDAKAMAVHAAATEGISVHDWLDRTIRAEASRAKTRTPEE